jgi:hypothetical protein
MNDRSWLLNPSAIAVAKKCIAAVKDELGVKLKLSHPQFMSLLHEYVVLTESPSIEQAYRELAQLSGDAVIDLPKQASARVVGLDAISQLRKAPPVAIPSKEQEMVSLRGRQYPRYSSDGLEFKGLYRGQARYA